MPDPTFSASEEACKVSEQCEQHYIRNRLDSSPVGSVSICTGHIFVVSKCSGNRNKAGMLRQIRLKINVITVFLYMETICPTPWTFLSFGLNTTPLATGSRQNDKCTQYMYNTGLISIFYNPQSHLPAQPNLTNFPQNCPPLQPQTSSPRATTSLFHSFQRNDELKSQCY